MFEDGKDLFSRFFSLCTSVLMLDTPRRTIYGVILGYILEVLAVVIVWFGFEAPPLSTFQYVVLGVFVLHFRTLFEMTFGKRKVSEKYEEQFAVISQAEAKGLSKAHVKLQLLQVCQTALKDASLAQRMQEELAKMDKESRDD